MGCGAGAQRHPGGDSISSDAEVVNNGKAQGSAVANAWDDEETAVRELVRRASLHSKISDAKIDELDPRLKKSSSSLRASSKQSAQKA
mmetsp:Transcript_13794/g.39713  ORF Transcript_13794/g.39713 Transcript_13794/m.39713 type:complete len:88 (-) Transcript_13794:120-383(-)